MRRSRLGTPKQLMALITMLGKRPLSSVTAILTTLLIVLLLNIPKSANHQGATPSQIPNAGKKITLKHATKAAPQQVSGKVVKVSDGDTVTLLLPENTQLKVRLLGIDAPEKSQPFGEVCRQNLAQKIAGKDVTVEVVQNDRYGRSLGKIELEGQDINLDQIKDGCAWHYKQYSSNQQLSDRELYSETEINSRAQKKGLWQDPSPEQPWQYRLESRQGKHRSGHLPKRKTVSEQ